MSRANAWKLPAAGLLLGVTFVAALSALAALGAQTGPLMSGRIFGLADSHDRRAFRMLEASRAEPSLAQAASEAEKALALAPYNNAARLRLTYIDTLRAHTLTPAGRVWLAQSYDLVPFDHTIAAWRVQFALEHWERLTPDLRKAVEAEAMGFGRGRSLDANVLQVLENVRNPAGRVSAALWLQSLKE